MDFARDMIFFGVPSFQFVPSLYSPILMEYVRIDLHKTQERFEIPAVVNVDADFRMFPKDVTVGFD